MSTTQPMTAFPDCPEVLDEAAVARFRDEGFLAFENVLSPAEVEAARTDISELIRTYAFDDERTELHPHGKGMFGGALFQKRDDRFSFQCEKGYEPSPDKLDELETKVRKLFWFEHETPHMEHLAFRHPRIQNILTALIGPDSQLFQAMALVKPPFIGSEKPWHQDNAYFRVTPLDAIIGVWIALDDAAPENGCMHVLVGGHKAGAHKHHHTTDCEILPGRIDTGQAVPVPLKAGGAMFFYGLLPHQTPPNRSDQRRRALQFHYHSADATKVSTEEYDRVFAEKDGTPASCAFAAREQDKTM